MPTTTDNRSAPLTPNGTSNPLTIPLCRVVELSQASERGERARGERDSTALYQCLMVTYLNHKTFDSCTS